MLGLSGGIDSALTLCIAVDALGPAEVEAVLMPTRYTATMSVVDARAQAEALGVAHRYHPRRTGLIPARDPLPPGSTPRPDSLP